MTCTKCNRCIGQDHHWMVGGPGHYVCKHCPATTERGIRDELSQLKRAALTAEVNLGEIDLGGTWREHEWCGRCSDSTLQECSVVGIDNAQFPMRSGKTLTKRCRTVALRCMRCDNVVHDFQLS